MPRDVSVVGYDDSAMLDFTAPSLTAVRQSTERIAELVGRIVTARIANPVVDEDAVLVDPELRIRASTAPVRF